MKYKLKDIFDLQMGKTPSRSNSTYWGTKDYKWISIADLSKTGKYISDTKEYLSEVAIEESGIRVIPANTVVMSFKLSIGKTAITAENMYSNEAIMAFHDRHVVEILPEYIFYMFKYRNWDKGSNKAVLGKTLNKATLSEIEIDICSIDKQKEIVKILDEVMIILAKRESELSLLNELIKARFVEMFGDCVANPKQWKTQSLEKIANVGSSKRVFVDELKESGIPFYRGTEVGTLAEGKSITPELFITEERYKELSEATGIPQIGDLLMPSICPDGRIWFVNTDRPFYFKDGRVLWIHLISEAYNPVFLLYTLKDRIMTDYSSIASGSTFAELKIFALKKCQVFETPLELQNQFADFVRAIEKSKLPLIKQSTLQNI